jgi:formylglycine-generating enzyme required for sulfatase activity
MAEKPEDLETRLQEVEDAIAALRKALEGVALEGALAPLLKKRERYEALLEGSGAVAQGEGATAAGERGIAVQGDVEGHAVTGDGVTIHPDPAQSAARRARRRYLERVHQQCNVLPLAAMGGEEGVGDEVSLDQVYVDLDTKSRVPVTEEEKAARKDDLSVLMRRQDRESRPLTALEAVTEERRLALLGDPGSGKSTFVRQLAARTARAHLAGDVPFPGWERGLVPVLVALRELAPKLAELDLYGLSESTKEKRLVETVREFLTARLHACKAGDWDSCLEDALLAGDVLLIFDGLDEVAEACRGRVRRAVGALLHSYGKLRRVIVTCRVRSYTGDAVLPGFAQHTLAPFDEDKIRAFVVGWYRAQYNLGRLKQVVADDRASDLQRAALGDDLRELSSNPMLLTTMALIHQREVGLPKERVRLYSLAVQVLLTRWQKRKGFSVSSALADVLGDDLKLRAIMERLAYEAHQGQADRSRAADLERRDVLAILEETAHLGDVGLAAEFLDYVDQRAGLLVGHGGSGEGRVPKTYTFPHRTFQEYLAGCHMVGEWDALDVYWRHAGEGDTWYLAAVLGAEELRYNRRSVKELLNLAYDLVPEGAPETEQAWRATLWSGQMAALFPPAEIGRVMQGPKSGAVYLERLRSRLVRILREELLPGVERAEAGKALAKVGDPRSGVGFRDDGLPEIVWCEVPAGPFLMGSTDEDERAFEDEKPQHTYRVEQPYAISRYPVTNAQYGAFAQNGGYTERRYWTEAGWAWRESEGVMGPQEYGPPYNLHNHPLVGVSWYEAVAFCRWLTEELRRVGSLTEAQKITLPTEPQWEKAARGTDARIYPWGVEPDPEKANYGDTGIGATSAVGCFPGGASPYGVEDLSGNIWEWTGGAWGTDWKEPEFDYPYDPEDGRESLEVGDDVRRVVRGGAFLGTADGVRCACRSFWYPDGRYWNFGFRVVASPFRRA